jgi:hypothetical protein
MTEMPPSAANENLESHDLEKYIREQISKLEKEIGEFDLNILSELNKKFPNRKQNHEESLALFRAAVKKDLEDFTRLCEDQLRSLISTEKSGGFLNFGDCKNTIDASYSNASRKINKLSSLVIEEI